jgi:hypothetical protein
MVGKVYQIVFLKEGTLLKHRIDNSIWDVHYARKADQASWFWGMRMVRPDKRKDKYWLKCLNEDRASPYSGIPLDFLLERFEVIGNTTAAHVLFGKKGVNNIELSPK